MALHLSVPPQEDKPLVKAETRPGTVQDLLARIPEGEPLAAAQSLREPLSLLNRQAVRDDVRLRLIELYRPVVLDTAATLAARYHGLSLPLAADAEAAARAARSLLTELAYGYKLAVLDHMGRVFSIGGEKTLATLIQRAIHALDQLLQIAYYTYTPAPDGIWSEIHRLYLVAAQKGVLEVPVADRANPSSVTRAYRNSLLLALSNPQRLTSDDLDSVRDYIERFGHLAQIRAYGIPENPAGIFVVKLKFDQPPVPFAKHKGKVDIRTDILLVTIELARKISMHLKGLQENQPLDALGLPDGARFQHYQDLLKFLVRQWALSPKRTFARQQQNESINLSAGLAAVYALLGGEDLGGEEAAAGLDFTGKPVAAVERWLVSNESAGGMALAKFPGASSALGVGSLLALRSDRSPQWGLGIVRWANSGERDELEIGVQMLAPGARAVAVRLDKYQPFQPALLLPELKALKQPATLITAGGIYQPARMLEVQMAPNERPIRLLATRLLERTGSFECFQFSLL